MILRNAKLVLPDEIVTGTVELRDGLISRVDAGPGRVGEDLEGDFLLPGLVELHTDHLEYHATPRPGTTWDTLSAVLAHDAQLAASGVTTVLDALRVGTDVDAAARLNDAAPAAAHRLAAGIAAADSAGILRARHYLHLRCEVPSADCLTVFDSFADDPRVLLVSLMDHTPGQRQFATLEAFRRYVVGKGRVTDAEFAGYVTRLSAAAEQYSAQHRVAIAARVKERGIVLATHDDATVEHVLESVALGGTIAEFPTTVPAARAAVEHGQRTVLGAPNLVLGGSQSGNVPASALLELGLLHILSSDYVPASPLQAIIAAHAMGTLPLNAGARLVSANPAAAVGLTDRGTISVGARADLVRVRVHSPAAGAPVPVVRGVWRSGTRVC